MGGQYQYFFRLKINAIRKFISSHDDRHLMFLDCDTYVIGGLKVIKERLDKGIGLMHKDEGSMTEMKGPCGKMWHQTKGKEYAGIVIDEKYHMWNSGVFAIPQPHLHTVMDLNLAICDAFLADGVIFHALEQWGGAIALSSQAKGIEEADKFIGHYWHHKEVWSRYITSFFITSFAKGRNIESEIAIIKNTNFRLRAIRLNIKRICIKGIRKMFHRKG